MASTDVSNVFLTNLRFRFEMYKKLGDATLDQLSDADLNWQPNPESNSISIIVRHLHGNMVSRWTDIFTTDGEKDSRDRDAEFVPQEDFDRIALLEQWESGWSCLMDTVNSLSPDDLLRDVTIRGRNLTVIDAALRQLPHVASHVGQMQWIGKARLGESWVSLSIPRGESRNAEVTAQLERDFGGSGRQG